MPGLMRYEWKHRLRPVIRIGAFILVIEGGLMVAEAFTASPLPRILSYLSSSDNSVQVQVAKQARQKIRYEDYDPYAGNRNKAEREENADAPPEDADALPLPAAVDNLPPPNLPKSERRCLAEAVYFEGRHETIEGQIAVAQVVLNRVRSGKWPSTICAVVRQGRGENCQFPAVCTAAGRPPENDASWAKAAWIADDTAAGRAWLNELTEATHYHNASAKPAWRLSMRFIRKVGWRLYYADPKVATSLVKLSPGQAPLSVSADKVATADAQIEKQDAEEAKRNQRERLAEQKARLASAHKIETGSIAVKVKPAGAVAMQKPTTNAADMFSRMER
jgi:spore germination cell wall hydrolase CwlJ-like protein